MRQWFAKRRERTHYLCLFHLEKVKSSTSALRRSL